jgi:hypothetical protein
LTGPPAAGTSADLADLRRAGLDRAGRLGRAFDREQGDRLAVGRPARGLGDPLDLRERFELGLGGDGQRRGADRAVGDDEGEGSAVG